MNSSTITELKSLQAATRSEIDLLTKKLDAIEFLLHDNGGAKAKNPQPPIDPSRPERKPRPAKKRKLAKTGKRRPPRKSINWIALRNEWENGAMVLRLAEKYGVHQTTIDSKKRSEGWVRRVEPEDPKRKRSAPPGTCPKCRFPLTNGTCSHCGHREQ